MSRDLPEGWRTVRLGEVAHEDRSRNADGIIPSEHLVGVFKNEGMIPMRERVKGASVDRCKIVQPGAFAYNPMRINIGSIARSAFDHAVMVSPDYVVFSANEGVLDGSFLEHLRRSAEWGAYVGTAGDGGVRIRIYFDHLAQFRFALPPLHEQSRIAEILSGIDDAIAATRAVIEQIRKVKQGVLERLLTKGIGHTRFKQTEIGEIPEGWEVATLGDLSEFVTSGSRGWAAYYSEEGAAFLRIANLTRSSIRMRLDEIQRVSLPPSSTEGSRTRVSIGDILISITADLGIIGQIPEEFEHEAYVNQHIALVRPLAKQILSSFLAYALSGPVSQKQFQHLNDSGAKAGLNLPTIRRFSVPLPPMEEQRRIAENISSIDDAIETEEKHLTGLTLLKSALMSDLFSGRKRVAEALPMAAE